MTTQQTDNILWEAVQRRDRNHDDQFVYGVSTSGVYCRPSCPSRRPLRKNVQFFDNPREAEKAGFRACLRCRPTSETAEAQIAAICRYIAEHAAERIVLNQLAQRAGKSPFHFQRLFKRVTGLSPKKFQDACRANALRERLREGAAVTDAIYAAGYGSNSRPSARRP